MTVSSKLAGGAVALCLMGSGFVGCCRFRDAGSAARAEAVGRMEQTLSARPKSVQARPSRKQTDERLVAKLAEKNARKEFDAIWLGDSITHFWEMGWTGGPDVFKERFGKYSILNFGFGGDQTQHVLWFIENAGVLDGVRTKVVNLMVGTNNMWGDSADEISAGVLACVKAIRLRQPKAKVVLLSILPREVAHERNERDYRKNRPEGIRDQVMAKTAAVNGKIRNLADGKSVFWLDLTARFTDKEGLPDLSLLCDGTHPNAAGYRVIADEILGIYGQVFAE